VDVEEARRVVDEVADHRHLELRRLHRDAVVPDHHRLALEGLDEEEHLESTSIRLSVALVVVSRANELVERMRRRAERDPAERANQVADAAVSYASKGRREVWSSAHLRRSSSASADTASRSLGEAKCMSRKSPRLVGGVDMGAW
jgi:hypothetical protein